ncbi:MAG: metal-dependent transcriptional regulator [Actinomycetaceae bacterium]|nr:metal-dependent transcriptional regulator [Actinomycetaceae bacterium]
MSAGGAGRSERLDSVVAQDYVKTIYASTEWGGTPISVTGLAQRLGVAPSTASETIKRLAQAGLVEHAPYRGVRLSEEGRREALTIIRRHRILETYLHDRLGFDWDEVHQEAEALEHAVSDRLIDRMDAELGRPRHDPHGDPIPEADGTITYADTKPLADLGEGETSYVVRISDRDGELLRFLRARDLNPGQRVRLRTRRDYAGTIAVDVGAEGREEQMELGVPAALAVWVRA